MTNEEFRSTFRSVQLRPGMYGIPSGLTAAIAYMLGCDLATGNKLFEGFSSWINRRHGGDGRTSLIWYGEIIAHAFAGLQTRPRGPYWEFGDVDAMHVESVLFDMVDQFLASRSSE
jgi:hypothetical protein